MVRKRKGQENVELLGEDDQSSWFFSSKKKKKKSKDTIHALVSYRGFFVLKDAQDHDVICSQENDGPIKFWLFENYLTPSFKAGAQALGEKRF